MARKTKAIHCTVIFLSIFAVGSSIFSQNLEETAILGSHRNRVHGLAYSPDGRFLVSGSSGLEKGNLEGEMIIWKNNRLRSKAFLKSGVWSLAITPDSKKVATGSLDGSVTFWTIEDGKVSGTIQCPDGVYSLCFCNNGATLITGGVASGMACAWDTKSHKLRWVFKFMGTERVNTARSRLNNVVALASGKVVVCLDPTTGRVCREFNYPGIVSALSLNSNGKLLAVGSLEEPCPIKVYDWNLRNVRLNISINSTALVFFPDDQRMAVTEIGTDITLWDINNGERVNVLKGHRPVGRASSGIIGSVTISPDGRTIVAGHPDGTVVLWQLNTR